jgi:hypothetical protein
VAASPRLTLQMRTGWLVNLVLVLAVAGLAFYALYKPKDGESTPQYALTTLSPLQVKRIVIEPQGGSALELQKEGEEWFLVQPMRARADRTQVDRVLDLLKARSKEKLAANDLQRFDLDKPVLKVTYDDQAVSFGTTNPLSQEQYVHAGDGVYLLSSLYRSQVPERPERVLTHALFRQNEKPVAFRFKTFSVEQHDGKWQVTPPAGKEPPSQDDLNRWVDDWRLASSLLTQPANAKTSAKEWVDVSLAGSSTLRLGIVERAPQLILLRPDEKLTFQLSEEMRDRLLTAPVAPEPPVPTSGTGAANSATQAR